MKLHIRLALLLGSLCLPAWAHAQQPGEAEYAVVIRDMPLKALPGRVYYQIGQAGQGDVVEVLDERFDWALVRSELEPVEGYLPQAATRPGAEPGTAVTNSRVNILAPDRGGYASSLFSLTVAEPGTTLDVVERFTEDGTRYLRVVAPRPAGGWLPLSALGPASAAQVQAYREAVAELTGEPLETPAAQTPPTAEETGSAAEETPPAAEEGTPGEQPADAEQPEQAEPTESDPAEEQAEPEPQKTPLEEQAEEAGVMTPAQLVELSKTLLEEDIRQAEFEPALVEFERTMEALELTESRRKALTMRKRTLEIRQRVQESLLRAEGALETAERESQALARQVEQLEGKGTYNLSGRLLPSTVYTGDNLPKLYRLQSLATLSTRTRAYVDPGKVDGIQRYLDQVVGVTGPVRYDDTLGIFVITAANIQVLDEPAGADQ